jgi:hypothetical protein
MWKSHIQKWLRYFSTSVFHMSPIAVFLYNLITTLEVMVPKLFLLQPLPQEQQKLKPSTHFGWHNNEIDLYQIWTYLNKYNGNRNRMLITKKKSNLGGTSIEMNWCYKSDLSSDPSFCRDEVSLSKETTTELLAQGGLSWINLPHGGASVIISTGSGDITGI